MSEDEDYEDYEEDEIGSPQSVIKELLDKCSIPITKKEQQDVNTKLLNMVNMAFEAIAELYLVSKNVLMTKRIEQLNETLESFMSIVEDAKAKEKDELKPFTKITEYS